MWCVPLYTMLGIITCDSTYYYYYMYISNYIYYTTDEDSWISGLFQIKLIREFNEIMSTDIYTWATP